MGDMVSAMVLRAIATLIPGPPERDPPAAGTTSLPYVGGMVIAGIVGILTLVAEVATHRQEVVIREGPEFLAVDDPHAPERAPRQAAAIGLLSPDVHESRVAAGTSLRPRREWTIGHA
jgi:hypothetical protein